MIFIVKSNALLSNRSDELSPDSCMFAGLHLKLNNRFVDHSPADSFIFSDVHHEVE